MYLVTASLPLGVFPKPELLQEFELDGQYFPLIDALKVNLDAFSKTITRQQLLTLGCAGPSLETSNSVSQRLIDGKTGISEKAPTCCYGRSSRSFAGGTWRGERVCAARIGAHHRPRLCADDDDVSAHRLFVAHSGNPQPGTAPPTLPLKAFLATARLAFDDPSLDIDDVEAMCASLLDQVSSQTKQHRAQAESILTYVNLRFRATSKRTSTRICRSSSCRKANPLVFHP